MVAEKRNLTILFCDLLGSTEMTEQLPLNDFLELMQSYHDCLFQCVTSQYGYVAQHLGDGIMAYFGYPFRFKEAPTNAIKSGLSILRDMSDLETTYQDKFSCEMSMRISIHTGIVLMADLGIGNRRERLALGGTPNIAARLQGVVPPNAVVVSEATYQLAKKDFTFRSIGHHLMKGLREEMECFQVVDPI